MESNNSQSSGNSGQSLLPEVIAPETKVKTTVVANKVKKPKAKKGEKVIQVTKSLAGKFGLSFHIGQFIAIEEKQADEIIDAGYGK